MKIWILLIAFMTVAGCSSDADRPASSGAQPASAEEPFDPVKAGDMEMAPDFELPTLEGENYKLSERAGNVVIVNFWATWCGPCIRETPAFVDLQNEWRDRPFEIVGVSLDEEGFELVRPFVEEYQVTYPMVVDDGTLADEFGGVYAMPSSFILDKEGRIVHRVVGEFPFDQLRDELERLIEA